jgi:catechol 2,3-dioxygenase-like lactoylglutathione lyase family enzyme
VAVRITFAGVSHVAFTVTDLDASQRFYSEVLDFIVVMDVGNGRICMHPSTGLSSARRTSWRWKPNTHWHLDRRHPRRLLRS